MSEREPDESGYDGRFGHGTWNEIINRAHRAGQREMRERAAELFADDPGKGWRAIEALPITDPADGEVSSPPVVVGEPGCDSGGLRLGRRSAGASTGRAGRDRRAAGAGNAPPK